MTGSLFARALKHNPDLRRDFEVWLKEQRAEHSHILESAVVAFAIYQAQGRIQAIDALAQHLEGLLNDTSDAET